MYIIKVYVNGKYLKLFRNGNYQTLFKCVLYLAKETYQELHHWLIMHCAGWEGNSEISFEVPLLCATEQQSVTEPLVLPWFRLFGFVHLLNGKGRVR